jgi:hypothetical protein
MACASGPLYQYGIVQLAVLQPLAGRGLVAAARASEAIRDDLHLRDVAHAGDKARSALRGGC